MITVDRLALLRALEPVGKAVDPDHMQCRFVRLRLDDVRLSVSATKLSEQVETVLGCGSDGKGAADVAFEPKPFTDAVRALAGDKVDLSFNSERAAVVSSGKSKIRMPWVPAEDVPALTVPSVDEWISIGAATLRDAFGVRYAASGDSTRPRIWCVRLDAHGLKLTASATDGHRLARHVVTSPVDLGSWPAQIPPPGIALILDAIGKLDTDVEIGFSASMAFVRNGDLVVGARVSGPEDTFPAVGQMFADAERKATTRIVVPTTALLAQLDRVIAAVGRDAATVLRSTAGTLRVTAASLDRTRDISDEIDCDVDGPEAVSGMSTAYLREAVKALECDETKLVLGERLDPVLIEGVNRQALIMPMRD